MSKAQISMPMKNYNRENSSSSTLLTVVLHILNFFRSPIQYLPPFSGGGLSHSLPAELTPPPQVLEHSFIFSHVPQPPFTAAGRSPISTHLWCTHHWITNVNYNDERALENLISIPYSRRTWFRRPEVLETGIFFSYLSFGTTSVHKCSGNEDMHIKNSENNQLDLDVIPLQNHIELNSG